jgi:hypothetical protein
VHPPTDINDAEVIARWEKNRAMGRTDFILRRGVLSWGVPAALLTIIYKVVQEQGFVATPRLTDGLRAAIIVALLVFPLCGWLFGRWLWTTGEARYRALVNEENDAGSAPRRR